MSHIMPTSYNSSRVGMGPHENHRLPIQHILQMQNRNIANMNRDICKLGNKIKEVQTETHANSAHFQNLTDHIKTSDNNFSIDNVNTITKEYIKCVNKLNFTTNLINEKKDEIQGAGEYASVLRPIFENKYTDNAVSINGYIVVASAEPVKMIHFFEPDSNWDNKQNNIWNVYREKCETDGYNRFNELRSKSPKKMQFYVLIPYDWELGVKIAFFLYTPDILDKTGKEWIKIVSGFNLTPSITKYAKVSDLPASYISYLGKIEDAFNTFSSNNTDYKLGTIYQFGPDNKFNTLKIISSVDYPSWKDEYIVNSYIPGSNIDMPNIIYQINVGLNRNYTGMHEGEVVIVEYVIGSVYYTGVIKMILVDGYDGLCYQIQSININDLFETSVQMTGDVDIQGNLNVTRYNGDSVISTDNTRKVTTFHDKVGINQRSHEVNGLLDIDNMTQQTVLDLFDDFVPGLTNSYDIIQVIIKHIANKSEIQPYTNLSQFPVGKTDNVKYNSSSNNMDFYMPNNHTKGLEAVLYVHGGSFVSGNEEDKDAVRAMERFNSEGYIACSMAYSLQHPPTGGFTQEWWNNAVIKSTNDLIDAIEYIKSLGATGLHIIGYSAGAIMVLMTALNDKHPFTDILKKTPPNFILTRTSIGGSLITPDGFSIVKYLDANCPPLLLWNGTADKTVDQKGAIAIKQKYTELGKSEKCQLYLLDGSTHSSILIDTYKGKNALDVSIAFVGSSLFTLITEMFADNTKLFDYRNQCTVFSVPIKAIIKTEDINILHTDGIEVVVGNQTSVGIGKSILSNNYTFKLLQQHVKEVNQMKSEIISSSDNSNIFSFIELVCNDNKNWYVVSMRAITDIVSMSDINSNSNMLFVMTYINVTNIMVDQSYYTVFTKLFDYVSRECRFMNYVALLFKNNTSNNTNRLVDASGNLTKDANGNPLIALAIKNNEYFSSRLGLLPESYIYLYTLRDDTSGYDNTFTLHESNPQWNGQNASDCWNGDSNVGVLVNIINDQQYQLYNNRQNSIFAVNYVWTSFRKVAFINLITINNVRYILGSGFNLNSLLGPTMVVRGDNSVSGNFYVNDSTDNNIFKVDNVTKTISNLYKVGIGMSELPKSILHVTDTTVSEIIAETDAAAEQYVILNKLARKLREAPSEASFNDIITELNVTQTVNNYFGIYRINQETFLSTDITVVYHWLYPQWQTYSFGNIIDSVNNVPIQISIGLYQNILDEDAIYDGRMCFRLFSFVFGWKLLRIICFKNKYNGNMYFLLTGTNIQNYGIRYNSNNNLQRLYDQRIRSPNILAEIDRRIRIKNNEAINPYYNIFEGLNSLNVLNKTYNSIRMNQFKIDLNINNLFEIKVTKIIIPLDTSIDDISFGSTINCADLSFNDRTKFANMHTYLTSKYTNIQIGDYFLLRYDDLSVDYTASSKCIDVSGQTITLILNEFSIQDCINPSLYVNGDTQLCGELMVGNENDRVNYVSIDSNRRFFGVNTDERFINYSDMLYTTTTNRYTPKHNVYIKNDTYPVMVSERICEDASRTDVSNNDYIKFGTYTAFTVKRKSNIYDYSTLARYADYLEMDFRAKRPTDTVTHMRYGPDISFELCDKDNKTVELGQLQLTLDGMDASGNLQCGFGVSVNDYDKGTSFGDIRRNIIYVDNSSTLFVKQINLGGKVLSTDGSGNLLCDGGNIYVSSANYPYQRVFPTIQQLQLNLNNKFIIGYRKYVHSMIDFFNTNLTNVKYMDLLDDYSLSNSEYQKTLVSMVNHYDISKNPVRVQMVTVSGNIFADSNYSENYGDVSTQSTNIYNNPEISQAILVGVGGMARCTTNTKLLNVCIGTENKWGTIVLTRLIMEVPVE